MMLLIPPLSKRLPMVLFILVFPMTAGAQDTPQDTIWRFSGFFSQQFNQSSFTHWASGGENSLSSTSILNLTANYTKDVYTWENQLQMAYGIIKTENLSLRKNEDKIDFLSRFGRRLAEKLLLSAQLNFQTQFDKGFNYPNDSVMVSKFMSPGYLTISTGLDYRPWEMLAIYFSPLAGKFTFVTNDSLAQQGAFGVDPGENVRAELGALLSLIFNSEVMENVMVSSQLDFFNGYASLDHIDVDWETSVNMKINRFLTASLLFHLIYDHDTPIPLYETLNGERVQVGTGPRTQLKQLLGVGFSYNF